MNPEETARLAAEAAHVAAFKAGNASVGEKRDAADAIDARDETIEEEIADDDEEVEKKSRLSHSSHSSQRQRDKRGRKNSIGDYINHQFLSLVKDKIPKARSLICKLESEAIAEELEEYEYQQSDMRATLNENMHCFKVPTRNRSDSEGMI